MEGWGDSEEERKGVWVVVARTASHSGFASLPLNLRTDLDGAQRTAHPSEMKRLWRSRHRNPDWAVG